MSDEHKIVTAANGEQVDLSNFHTDHTASDLFKVGFVYAAGGGGVSAIIGVRFLILGKDAQDHAAGIMFFVVASLMVAAGVWCHIKRARLLKASK